jgi:hypothetical protein
VAPRKKLLLLKLLLLLLLKLLLLTLLLPHRLLLKPRLLLLKLLLPSKSHCLQATKKADASRLFCFATGSIQTISRQSRPSAWVATPIQSALQPNT